MHRPPLTAYRPQLDSLRAFAVTSVLLAHFWLPQTGLSTLGVRLFFVLSGFLLTSILLRERAAAKKSSLPRRKVIADFYARRILRIWPAYYAALIAAVILGADQLAETFGWHALFASNILFFVEQRWYPPVTAPLWTLSIEEQFYLFLPLVILFVPAAKLRWLIAACIISAIAYRVAVPLIVAGSLDFYFVLPFAQLDALGAGALLAVIQSSKVDIDWRRLLCWSLPPAAVVFLFADRVPVVLSFAIAHALYLLPMIAIVAGANAGIGGLAGRVLSAAAIVAIGRISYGIYLYHNFVAAGADQLSASLDLARPEGPLRFLLYFTLTTAMAAVSWLLLERPALSLRRHFRTSAAGAALVPAAPGKF